MVTACGLCVVVTVGSQLIVHVLYGKQFLPAAPLLAVLIWSEIAVFFATVVGNVMVVKNQQNLLPIPTLAGAAINVALNLVLIPKYAAMGAACATLISYTVAWMVVLLFFGRMRSVIWQGLRFAFPVITVALLAVACASRMPNPILASLGAGVAIFAVGLVVTKQLRRSDVSYLSVVVRQLLQRASS
jgi:PST family polysaccharide transporter